MTYGAIWLQVKARTKAQFGLSLNPHGFRDCAATAIATYAPDQSRDIALVLGHAGMSTSEKHYNQAKMLSANTKLQDVVDAVMQRMIAPIKPKRGAAP